MNGSLRLDLDKLRSAIVPDAANEHTEEFAVRLLIEPCFLD